MKKTQFTEEQIAIALRQSATGTRIAEVCRKTGISEAIGNIFQLDTPCFSERTELTPYIADVLNLFKASCL